MDAIVGLLDGPRARGAFLLRVLMDALGVKRVRGVSPRQHRVSALAK